jgi:crotonobetainyl-CoA:carnitine CoA-transferase CaiB-like acyl-CoA transferase
MLSHLRVLDLTDEKGLLCGQMLADLGADVVCVEPQAGSAARRLPPFADGVDDGEHGLVWWAYSRGKRSVLLDIERERDRFLQLVRAADVLVESFPPGHLDALGLGYDALAEANPRLIMASLSPFGGTGPKAHWAATDLTTWAAAGPMYLTGDEDRAPLNAPWGQAWLHASAEASAGILIALAARERDGAGQHIDVSAQTASAIATQSYILESAWKEQVFLKRFGGGVKTGQIKARFVYPAADGHVSITFLFGNVIGPFTARLFQWIWEEGGCDEATRDKDWPNFGLQLMTGESTIEELDRCTALIERFTSTRTKQQLCGEALRRGLLIVPVSTTEDVTNSVQLRDRAYWTDVAHNDGRAVRYPGPFARFQKDPIAYRGPAPRLGEHTAQVVKEWQPRDQSPSASRGGAGQRSESRPALEGLKVLDFTWAFVAPVGVRFLSDYGATVVHVESQTRMDVMRMARPFWESEIGVERSASYINLHPDKLGITLNLKTPEGRETALKLAEWADVIVENFTPHGRRHTGLDYEEVRQRNPGVIMLSTCLNGQSGRDCELAGFGTMGAQLSGFGNLVGWPDRMPVAPFGAYTDYIGPKFIGSAILAALEHRRRTGEGQWIDLSQAECAIHFLTPAILDYTVNGNVQQRVGNLSRDHAPHGVYRCAGEDRWVAIDCATDTQWRALAEELGRGDWLEDTVLATAAGRLARHAELDLAIGQWTAGRDVGDVEDILQRAGVPVHRVLTPLDALSDTQILHRGHLAEVEHAELGRVPVEASRILLSRTPSKLRHASPVFGEHNERVLGEFLGLSGEAIAALAAAGALE